MSDAPVLLTGHLLFLGGLCLLAWLSWSREARLFSIGWRISPLVSALLIAGWSLLGLALTELAAHDSLNGRLEVADWSWLAGGAAFATALTFTSYFAGRMGLGERQNLFLPAAILTSLGLIVIYHWEARTGSGHALFFTQAGAAVLAMAAYLAVASAVARARLLGLLHSRAFVALANVSLVCLAFITVEVSVNGRPPSLSLPVGGSIILTPVLQLVTIVCLVAQIGQQRHGTGVWRSSWPLLGPGVAAVALLTVDLGTGLLLWGLVVLIVVLGSRLSRQGLTFAAGVVAVVALVVLLQYPQPLPSHAQARFVAWFNPWAEPARLLTDERDDADSPDLPSAVATVDGLHEGVPGRIEGPTGNRAGIAGAATDTDLSPTETAGASGLHDRYQQQQSLLALRRGRLVGTGFGLGQPERLPAATEDLSAAVLGEAMGFIGTATVVLVVLRLVWSVLALAAAEHQRSVRLLGFGLAAFIGAHALIAFGSALSLSPMAGIPLPFAGRSGTYLVVLWIALGLLMGLAPTIDASRRAESNVVRKPSLAFAAQHAVAAVVVATLFALQLAGHSISPGALWARLPEDHQAMYKPGGPEAATPADRGTRIDGSNESDAALAGGRFAKE